MAKAAPSSARRCEGRVVIVDDVITAGTSMRESVATIGAAGAKPAGVLIALDRMERGQGETSAVQDIRDTFGIPVVSIATLDDVMTFIDGRSRPCQACAPRSPTIVHAMARTDRHAMRTQSFEEIMKPLGNRAVAGRGITPRRKRADPADHRCCCRCCSRACACSPSRRAPRRASTNGPTSAASIHYSDKIPAEAVNRANLQLNRQGLTIRKTEQARPSTQPRGEDRKRRAAHAPGGARQAAGRAARPRAGRVVYEREGNRPREDAGRCDDRRPGAIGAGATSRRCRSAATSSRARRARTRHGRCPARSCSKSKRSTPRSRGSTNSSRRRRRNRRTSPRATTPTSSGSASCAAASPVTGTSSPPMTAAIRPADPAALKLTHASARRALTA